MFVLQVQGKLVFPGRIEHLETHFEFPSTELQFVQQSRVTEELLLHDLQALVLDGLDLRVELVIDAGYEVVLLHV